MEKIPLIPYIHMHILHQCQASNFAGQFVFHRILDRNQVETGGVVGGGIPTINPPPALGWEVVFEIGTVVHDIPVLEEAHDVVMAGLALASEIEIETETIERECDE
ncbi:non-ribosomal peptide synthetase [Sesbania bispinosa]|nr:non-ribosomal peptide synthetase [Sesbania bispinosa]